ncbi:MAG TPA: anthranilate phosphoribosyltransferase [Candidatus Omnitrophota bacterium]|nr:anthranilate phosphoribosyltransferase [Candidatus Omnitrophota bacterium]
MQEYIDKIQQHHDLTAQEMSDVMRRIMTGTVPKEELSAFLLALRKKGAAVNEITGAARIMREFAIAVDTDKDVVLDTCGTGGDRAGTFNISTAVAFVVAGAGCVVAKHGNRSVSSKCGSADVLEYLGVNVGMKVERLSDCLHQVGIAFLFAQNLHPAMRYAAAVRKELGVETIFNVLGPLTNPSKATHQMMGVYNKELVEPMAHVLQNLGLKKALVVHGEDGLDEITTTAKTFASEYNGQDIISYEIDPSFYGIPRALPQDLKGGSAETNAQIISDVLSGQTGAQRDIVILNAAYALYIAGRTPTVHKGIEAACQSVDTKKAKEKLDSLIAFTNQ